MTPLLLALALGAVTGLRTMAAPTAVAVAARLGWLDLNGTWLAWLGYAWTPWILALAAIAELVVDLLPTTPSRKSAGPFAARVAGGALAGAALGLANGAQFAGIAVGIIGAILGTLGGYAGRMRLARAFGRDRPAALLEDAVAYLGAALIVGSLR